MHIEFDPALISELRAERDHLAIVFPSQAMYGGLDDVEVHCELQVWGGTPATQQPALPLAAENISVFYRGGSRRCFLPLEFRVEGPVQVFAEIESGMQLLAEGDSLSLRVVEQSGTNPCTFESKPDSIP